MINIQSKIKTVFKNQFNNQQSIKNSSVSIRIKKLKSIENWLLANQAEIHKAMYADFKKPASEVDLTEIWTVVNEIRYVIRRLKKWNKPKKVKPTFSFLTAKAWIQCEPKGLVLIITPWNFPISLTLSPLVYAIAAGNCVIIKPSELTSNSSSLISKMVKNLFVESEVTLFEGGHDVAEALLSQPFNHIFFTGGPKVGRIVMEKAAKHLATITLELGGKSPTIIDESANIADAARKISWGKFLNSGQICLAPDYVLVHQSVKEQFLEKIKEASYEQFCKAGNSSEKFNDYARVVNRKHYERLSSLLNKSVESGCTIYSGGSRNADADFIEPTILTNVDAKSPIMEEEIFGPILPVIGFEKIEDAIDLVKKKPKPLGLYIFSKSKKNINYILNNTSAGGTSINDTISHYMHLNLPFGGINTSGSGRTHGKAGFLAFSNQRSILKQSNISPIKLLYPPYSSRVKKLIQLLIKYI